MAKCLRLQRNLNPNSTHFIVKLCPRGFSNDVGAKCFLAVSGVVYWHTTLYNFMQIKLTALKHRKNCKQVVSSGALRQFHNFYYS